MKPRSGKQFRRAWSPNYVVHQKPLAKLEPEAQHGLDDLFFFGKSIWGLDLLNEKPHRQMADDLMEVYSESGKNNLMNCVPRDCFKTTFASVCFACWVQLKEIYEKKNFNYRIFFNAATKEKSWALIEKIIQKWQYDEYLQTLYGSLQGGKWGAGAYVGYNLSPKFTSGSVSVVSEPNFFCGSELSEQTGKHSDLNIHDDLSEQKNSCTAARREKVILSYKNSISILRKDNGKQVMNCTAWHDADVRGYIVQNETRLMEEKGPDASRWKLRVCGAVLPDGDLYFPSRLTLEVLDGLRHDLGPVIFYSQYMNDPSAVGSLVKDDQIRWKSPKEFPEFKRIRITVDPAFGDEDRDNGDFYWITVGAFDQFNTLYVLDVRYAQDWGVSGFADQLFEVARDYPKYSRMYIEGEHRSALESVINLKKGQLGEEIRIQYVVRERSVDKWTRWLRLQPRFEQGRIFFNSDITLDAQSEIKEQLLRAPYGRHDDFLDTLADLDIGIRMKADHEEEKVDSPPVDMSGWRMRTVYDPVTKRYEGKLVPAEPLVRVPNKYLFDKTELDLMAKTVEAETQFKVGSA